MLSKHFIEWVYVQTENGGQRKALKPDDKPNVTFCLGDDKAVAVYAYCNLHGLWMTEVLKSMPPVGFRQAVFLQEDTYESRQCQLYLFASHRGSRTEHLRMDAGNLLWHWR